MARSLYQPLDLGAALNQQNPFKMLLPLVSCQLVSHMVALFTIGCIVKLSSYNFCINCNSKLDMPDLGNIVDCQNCKASMARKRCPKAFYCKVRLHDEHDRPLHFTLFDKSIRQLVELYNTTNPHDAFELKNLTEYNIKEAFAVLEDFKMTYDGSRVINIELNR